MALAMLSQLSHSHTLTDSSVIKVGTHRIVFEGETGTFSDTAIEASDRQILDFLRASRVDRSVQRQKEIPPPNK